LLPFCFDYFDQRVNRWELLFMKTLPLMFRGGRADY